MYYSYWQNNYWVWKKERTKKIVIFREIQNSTFSTLSEILNRSNKKYLKKFMATSNTISNAFLQSSSSFCRMNNFFLCIFQSLKIPTILNRFEINYFFSISVNMWQNFYWKFRLKPYRYLRQWNEYIRTPVPHIHTFLYPSIKMVISYYRNFELSNIFR